ncbi:MAG: hypothetical protein L6R42_010669 [Xanthoria sp. 1 TBL-2021]|nr:MAG: hypothetical protein L6R42_010669 [Xanthoria sp. 1 TBL-2021]
MTARGWPEPPALAGKPPDTVLLLNRDYRLEINDRINLSLSAQHADLPLPVFVSFSRSTQTLVNMLCDLGDVRPTTISPTPNNEPGSQETALGFMTAPGWPQAPDLLEKRLDTAFLLSRDYAKDLRPHIEHNARFEMDIPVNVWSSFSQTMKILVQILVQELCQQGKLPLNSLTSILKFEDALYRPRDPRPKTEDTRGEVAGHFVGLIGAPVSVDAEEPSNPKSSKNIAKKVANTRTYPSSAVSNTGSKGAKIQRRPTNSTVFTKSTKSKKSPKTKKRTKLATKQRNSIAEHRPNDMMDSGSSYETDPVFDDLKSNDTETEETATDSTDSEDTEFDESAESSIYDEHDEAFDSSISSPAGLLSRNKRQVTVTLRDRQARSKLSKLNRSQVLKLIRSSIREQGLQVIVRTCDKHVGQRANFQVRTKDAEGAGVLRREWNVGLVEAFGPRAYMRESEGFEGIV